jgi:IS30 family transposase
LSRELRRCAPGGYDATQAARSYHERRHRSRRAKRLAQGSALYQHVHDRLVYLRWSPQQIAARLHQMPAPLRPGLVSHETIYAAIYAQPRGGLKQAMVEALRQAKPARGRRRTTAAARSFVPEELRIKYRPQEIEQRLLPGHWEGDLIKGAYNRAVSRFKCNSW